MTEEEKEISEYQKSEILSMCGHCVSYDGLDYTMQEYSDWKEIEDKEFHRLRDAYIKSKEELGKKIIAMAKENGEDYELEDLRS